jgi:hypothetical protein
VFGRARAWIWHQIDRIRHRPIQGDSVHWRADHTPMQMLTGAVAQPPGRQRQITPAAIGGHIDRELEAG